MLGAMFFFVFIGVRNLQFMFTLQQAGRDAPLIHIFDDQRHDGGGSLAHAGNLADYLGHKAVYLGGILCDNLHTDISLADRTGHIADIFELRNCLSNLGN